MKGLTGYAQAVEDLQAENVKLGRQVLPSLKKEIHSVRKPPYDFECTMVRTDINHFSTIFNTHNVTEFMATINEFFDSVSRTVARYGGLVHEFVGDEVIYYFKDDEHENSFAIALSAIREINELAERFNASTQQARGYGFTVKSSLAHGKVRFGPLVGGFTIAGSILIETVRILGFIVEKDENVVYFDGVNSKRLGPVISGEERMQVKMKGYQSEISLHQYLNHQSLQKVLDGLSIASISHLSYYRSDFDLKLIIENLCSQSAARPIEVTLKAIRILRLPYIAQPTLAMAPEIRAWIAELSREFEGDLYPGAGKILSAAVMLYLNLVPREHFNQQDRELLTELLSSADRRVVANTVEVLTHFSASVSVKRVRALRDDLRIAANTLIHEGNEEITASVLKKLKTLLKSKKASEAASGLYALGELAMIHRSRDFAYYSAQVDFQALLSDLDLYAQHATTMVRRQALAAARKSANAELIDRIRLHVKDSNSELLAEELRRYLDNTSSSTHNNSAA
jgi:hypothetical protein